MRLGVEFALRLLLALYYPFLIAICAATVWVAWVIIFQWQVLWIACAAPFVVIILLMAVQLSVIVASLGQRPPEFTGLEFSLPRELLQPLYELVQGVAKRQQLTPPDEIRLAADSVAHVYEERGGCKVLVIGGPAVAALTQGALAGIIAHELAHFTAGDTQLSRRAFRRAFIMAVMGERFRENSWTIFNPLVWPIHLYHRCFQLVWAAHSRQQEFAADALVVKQAGKETAAAALVRLQLLEHIPWTRLDAIAKSAAATGEPIEHIFHEQWRRAKHLDDSDWDNAFRKAIREETGVLDTHPPLKSRLRAIGVKPKKALRLALEQHDNAARDLFANWKELEAIMTTELLQIYRALHEQKRELAQIFLGRPV